MTTGSQILRSASSFGDSLDYTMTTMVAADDLETGTPLRASSSKAQLMPPFATDLQLTAVGTVGSSMPVPSECYGRRWKFKT